MVNKEKLFFLLFFFLFPLQCFSKNFDKDFEKGKQAFFQNCLSCHQDGKNLIIPEKNLKKETLERNGMNTVSSIVYQIRNGKNGMPAFGERLNELEIETIAFYVLENEF